MLKRATRPWWLALVILASLPGCDEMKPVETSMTGVPAISAAEWQKLAQMRVVFGHQSVGLDIIGGIQSLATQADVHFPVVKSRLAVGGNGVIHFFVGENEDPTSKFKDFTSTLEGGAANGANVALMKLCYIDFRHDTDARELARQYSAMLDSLSQRFPNTTFIAVTAPLTILQTGPKAWAKRLLGREPGGYAENARRREFNDLLRKRYEHEGRLFDLARIEASGAENAQYQGRPIEVLNRTLTYDDGHLNAQGKQIVATQLIKYLAALPVR